MQSFEGGSDGTFEMTEDWLVECIYCYHQYCIDRNSINVNVTKQGDVFEHYFWTCFHCVECGKRLFIRTKVYGTKEGNYISEVHDCDDVDYLKPPIIRILRAAPPERCSNYIVNSGGIGMKNIWLLTEEKPKLSVIKQILQIYKEDFGIDFICSEAAAIYPLGSNSVFYFTYEVVGISVVGIHKIYIKTVSGGSSFLDFLFFVQEEAPLEGIENNLVFAVEETKTSDDESRNTGVYQRCSKFVYIKAFYPRIPLYMLYNDELELRADKKPSDTSILGTNMLLTNNVKISGKPINRWFRPFHSIEELIEFKNGMKRPPASNTPILINKIGNKITISGRLDKPGNLGKIAHDPNIGALSYISYTLRQLGWLEK